MVTERENLCTDEPTDCGSFFLCLAGEFHQRDVHVTWSNQPRETNQAVEELITQAWAEALASGQERGAEIFNGPACRLIEYSSDGEKLNLTLGPTNFREFIGTNTANAHIRYTLGGRVLSDPLGVSAAIVTADGFVMLGRRSKTVTQYPQLVNPIGGVLEPSPSPSIPPDPFGAIQKELIEETTLTDMPSLCLGMIRDKLTWQPELIFEIPTTADAEFVRRGAAIAADSHEHTELIAVRDDPVEIARFVELHINELTPLAPAMLLMHGRYRWGESWFAAAVAALRAMREFTQNSKK